MEAIVERIKGIGAKTGELAISAISNSLDFTAKGIALLSSVVKGEKKINIKIEEVK